MSIKYHTIDNLIIQEYEKKNIFIIEDILPLDYCDELTRFIDTLPKQNNTFGIGNNVKCYKVCLDELLKKSDYLQYKFSTENNSIKISEMIKQKDIYTNELNSLTISDIKSISNNIDTVMKKLGKILSNFNINFSANSLYIFRKIYGETRIHTDGISDTPMQKNIHYFKENKARDKFLVRVASFIFTLNDDYDGGEFLFPYHDLTIKLKKGSVLIFPPYWTHLHGTNELLNNTSRYTITTWGCESVYTIGL